MPGGPITRRNFRRGRSRLLRWILFLAAGYVVLVLFVMLRQRSLYYHPIHVSPEELSARYARLRSTDPEGVGSEQQESNLQKDVYTGQ